MSIKDIDSRAVIVLDIKTPGSGMWEEMDLSNLDYIKPSDEIKFVITDRADYEWSKDMMHKYNLRSKCQVFFLRLLAFFCLNHLLSGYLKTGLM